MKKNLLLIIIALTIVPQVSFASWWNPFTWKIFKKSVDIKTEQIITVPTSTTTGSQSSVVKKEESTKVDQTREIEKLKKEVDELKKEKAIPTSTKPTSQTALVPKKDVQPVIAQSKVTETIVPEAKNFKEPILEAINRKIESHKAITSWINNDMLMLLSQRENMLSDVISRTTNVMNSESDPGMRSIYALLISSYENDRNQLIPIFRKACAEVNANAKINTEILSGEYSKFSSKSFVSEADYTSMLETLSVSQRNWQLNYDAVQSIYAEFTKQTNLRDDKYQQYLSQIAEIITITSRTEALQTALNELRAQRVQPLNCTITSHDNGYTTEGRISCY